MKVVITNGIIDEMTLVGDGFAPRNPKAKALAVKAAAIQTPVTPPAESTVEYQVFAVDGQDYLVAEDAPSFVEATIKAMPSSIGELIEKGWMVPSKVKDGISGGSGDASDKYEKAAGHITSAHFDIGQATGISDNDARSHAIKHVVDSHIANMNAMQTGKDGKDDKGADKAAPTTDKAGRKFSKETVAKLADTKSKIDALSAEIAALYETGGEEEETEEQKAAAVKAAADAASSTPGDLSVIGAGFDKTAFVASIVEAVKASITMPADNTELLTSISTNVEGLATRLTAVESSTKEVAAKAASNEVVLNEAIGKAREPIAGGGLATHLENGVIVGSDGQEITEKAEPIKVPEELGAIDAALYIQEQHRNGRGRKR